MTTRLSPRLVPILASTALLAGVVVMILLGLHSGRTSSSSSSSVRSTNDQAFVKQVLNRILTQYREAMSNLSPHFTGAFRAQQKVHYREARLLALAYPLEMQDLLSTLARDLSLDRWERLCCIDLLGDLANTGLKAPQAILLELAKGSEPGLSHAALRNLASSDQKGEYQELYVGKCRELVRDAFDAVAYWANASAINELELILAKAQDRSRPEAQMRLAAQWTIQKLNILSSPECDQTLTKLLDGSRNEKDWFIWAVQVAKNRTLPGIAEALRRRLDHTEESLFGSSAEEELKRDGVNVTKDFEEGSTNGIGDRYFDEALIAYAEVGGKLNAAEQRRLYTAGYVCDPKKRLEELLSSQK